jgi:23S rRNA (guanosine2251-2'-O)-methyltransferase
MYRDTRDTKYNNRRERGHDRGPSSAAKDGTARLIGVHAVEEALRAGQAIDRVLVARGRHGGRLEEIVRLARSRGVPVRFEDRVVLDRTAATREHQGIVALGGAKRAVELEDLIAARVSTTVPGNQAGKSGLLVLLDGVEDPHNLGAIIRTALAAGAEGVIIPERRAAGLTEAVARASAGALQHLPVARVKNLVRAMEQLKEAGYWLAGLDERADRDYTQVDLSGRIALVLGNEGAGLHELTRKRCDFVVSIPTQGPVRSLNVSVAAGVILFECLRQRRPRASAPSTSASASPSASSAAPQS